MNGVGGIDGTTPDYDAQKRDDERELNQLRAREATLSAAYKSNPGDLATMGALVRVQQAIRHAEEHAEWTAQGGSMSAHDQLTSLGVKLPVDLAALPPAQLDASVVADASVVPPIAHARMAVAQTTLPASPYRGVGLYSAVGPELPPSNASAGDPIHVGPYRLHLATANGVGVYFVAYNIDTKRNEYAVGANEADVATFRGMQNSPFGVPSAEQIAQLSIPKSLPDLFAQRAMQAAMEGRLGDAAVLFGKSHLAAVTSLDWYMQNAAAVGLGMSGAAAGPLAEDAMSIDNAATRSVPDLRLVVNNATPEVRALETAVDGNAALALGPVAPRPALSLVPSPAAGAFPLEATSLAMPWMAPGLFALNAFRPATALGTTPTAATLRGAPGSDELANGCVGRPLGYHLGGDEVHNTCADNIGNDYPGSDYLVVTPEGTTRAFDLAKLPEVGEVKTGKLSYYSQELAEKTIEDYLNQSKIDQGIAKRCGLSFTLYVADPAAAEFFRENFDDVHVELATDPACKRP